jgi:hypothetical protein
MSAAFSRLCPKCHILLTTGKAGRAERRFHNVGYGRWFKLGLLALLLGWLAWAFVKKEAS